MDFTCRSSIILFFLRHRDFFFNCQARCILGADFATISESEVLRRLATYTYIATSENLAALYSAFGFAALPKEANDLRENTVPKYHFDAGQFLSREIKDFLVSHNWHDLRLYDFVLKTCWPAEGRSPFRPAFPMVLAGNYEEQSYLDANPDVAEAIKNHPDWRSGYDHFLTYGHAEQRRQLISPAQVQPQPAIVRQRLADMAQAADFAQK